MGCAYFNRRREVCCSTRDHFRRLTAVLGFSQTQKQTFKRIHVHHLIRTALYFVRIHVVSGTKTLVGDLFVCWCAHLGDSSFDWDSVMFERRIKFWLFVLFFNQFPRYSTEQNPVVATECNCYCFMCSNVYVAHECHKQHDSLGVNKCAKLKKKFWCLIVKTALRL